jgi:hypothetical protein
MNLSLGDIFKFLEITTGQAVVLLIACVGVDYGIENQLLPFGKYADLAVSVTRILIIFAAASLIWRSLDWVIKKFDKWSRRRKRRETISRAFDILGPLEREIVLCCVAINSQTFVKSMDDPVAKSLCERGLVRRPHGWVNMLEAPFMFYDDAWRLANERYLEDPETKEIAAHLTNT